MKLVVDKLKITPLNTNHATYLQKIIASGIVWLSIFVLFWAIGFSQAGFFVATVVATIVMFLNISLESYSEFDQAVSKLKEYGNYRQLRELVINKQMSLEEAIDRTLIDIKMENGDYRKKLYVLTKKDLYNLFVGDFVNHNTRFPLGDLFTAGKIRKNLTYVVIHPSIFYDVIKQINMLGLSVSETISIERHSMVSIIKESKNSNNSAYNLIKVALSENKNLSELSHNRSTPPFYVFSGNDILQMVSDIRIDKKEAA